MSCRLHGRNPQHRFSRHYGASACVGRDLSLVIDARTRKDNTVAFQQSKTGIPRGMPVVFAAGWKLDPAPASHEPDQQADHRQQQNDQDPQQLSAGRTATLDDLQDRPDVENQNNDAQNSAVFKTHVNISKYVRAEMMRSIVQTILPRNGSIKAIHGAPFCAFAPEDRQARRFP